MSLCNPKNCLICQSKDYRVIFSYDKPDQYEIAIGVSKEGYYRKWVQCKQCGFYYSIYSREKNILLVTFQKCTLLHFKSALFKD